MNPMKPTNIYMSEQTQNELLKQIFIHETLNKKEPIIRRDFAVWLGLENSIFWVASAHTVWRYRNNPSTEECAELVGQNLLILNEVFEIELEVLAQMIFSELRKIREEELRQIEKKQNGEVLN